MQSTPASLLFRLRQPGEQRAWEQLVDLYTPLLFHWSLRLGLKEPDAADLSSLDNSPSTVAGEGSLRIEKSIAWSPQGGNQGIGTQGMGINLHSHPSQCKIRMTADRSLFEAGGAGIYWGLLTDNQFAGWEAAGSVYRQVVPGFLQAVKTRWPSPDDGSRELLPLVTEPRAWKLTEQSPGYRSGLDGRDAGADTSRIAIKE